MAKKKGKKGGGKIPLESAVDSDLDEREVGARGKAWSDPMFAQEEEDTRELRNRMANAGGGDRGRQSAYGDSSVVFGISDSDSEEDAEVAARKRRKAEKKAMKKKGKGRQQQEEQEDDFASDLDEGGPSAPYEDELVGGEGWGKRKRHFYGGNPNERRPDKEKDRKKGDKGEEEEDEAEMEAQESRKLQARQLEDMDEGDFLDAFATPAAEGGKKKDKSKSSSTLGESIKTDVSALSRKDRSRLFSRECPEFSGVMAEFDQRMAEAAEVLAPVVRLMDEGRLPAEGTAADIVRTKYQIVLNYCTNLSCYLMFKARRRPLRLHPLTGRLVQYRQLLERMDPLSQAVMPQVEQVLKAMEEGEGGVEAAVKMARKRAVREAVKERAKAKKLKILRGEDEEDEEEVEEKADRDEDLTLDEARAVQMFNATKRKRKVSDVEEEDEEEEEDEGENNEEGDERRLITRQIEKNKGLTLKRSKLQRNPRVKHRAKFAKAKVRRKGQVREVRTEKTKYGGELSGINMRVKKGIKLA